MRYYLSQWIYVLGPDRHLIPCDKHGTYQASYGPAWATSWGAWVVEWLRDCYPQSTWGKRKHRWGYARRSELPHVCSWAAHLTTAKSSKAFWLHPHTESILSDQWQWGKKNETPLIGLYDLRSRMLLQMIYFESWFRCSENKHRPLHQRLRCQTQSFLAWKMGLLCNVEISQGYKEEKN